MHQFAPQGPSASEFKTAEELLRERAAVFDEPFDLLGFQGPVLRHLAFSVGNDAGQLVIRRGYDGRVREAARFHRLARRRLALAVRTMAGDAFLFVETRR